MKMDPQTKEDIFAFLVIAIAMGLALFLIALGMVLVTKAEGAETGFQVATGVSGHEVAQVWVGSEADPRLGGFIPDHRYQLYEGLALIDTRGSDSSGTIALQGVSGTIGVVSYPDTLPLPPCANLALTGYERTPEVIGCGDVIRVRVQVGNIGTQPAGASWGQIRLNGNPRAAWQCPALDPGATTWSPWTSLPSTAQDGDVVTACADYTNVVAESNETDNCDLIGGGQ